MKTGAITVKSVQFTGSPGQPTNSMALSMKNTATPITTVEMIKINEEKFFFNSSSGQDTTYAATERKA
jgi:hypothetical protein